MIDAHELWNFSVRGETPEQRLDRCYGELLQEVRVAQTGVQVLFAFLLWVAFTPGFAAVAGYQRGLYVLALVFASLSLGLLIAPACANRLMYRQGGLRPATVALANRCALGGLALLFASFTAVMTLILDVILGPLPAAVLGVALAVWSGTWWYALPLAVRHRYASRVEEPALPLPLGSSTVDTAWGGGFTCRWVPGEDGLTARWVPATPTTRWAGVGYERRVRS